MNQRVIISKKLLLANSASFLVASLLNIAVLIWVIGHLHKRIPSQDFQILALAITVQTFVHMLAGLLTTGLSRNITAAYAQGDIHKLRQISSSLFFACLIIGIVLAAATSSLAFFVDSLLQDPPSNLFEARLSLGLMMGLSSLFIITSPLRAGIEVKQKYVLANFIWLIGILIRIGLTIGLVLGIGPQVIWVVVAMLAANTTRVMLLTIFSLRSIPELWPHWRLCSWQEMKEQAIFGFWGSLGSISGSLRDQSGPALLSSLSPVNASSHTSNFFIGGMVDRQFRGILSQMMLPLMPVMTAMHTSEQANRLQSLFLRATRWVLWLSMAIATPLIVFREQVMSLYLSDSKPDAIQEAADVMGLLLLAWIFHFASELGPRLALAKGDVAVINRRSFMLQVTNVLLAIYAIVVLQWGALGAAVATLFTYAILYPPIMWPIMLKLVNTDFRSFLKKALLPGVLPFFVSSFLGYLYNLINQGQWLASQMPWDNLADAVLFIQSPLPEYGSIEATLIGSIITLAAYLLLSIMVLGRDDRNDLAKLIRRKLKS